MKEKAIAIFGTRVFDQNTMHFIDEIRKAGEKIGCYTMVFSADIDVDEYSYDVDGEEELFYLAKKLPLEFIVIFASQMLSQMLVDEAVAVGVAKNVPVFIVDDTHANACTVTLDYTNGFYSVARHIIEDHGFKKVNMIAGFKGNAFSDNRINIYKKVLEENGLPFEEKRLGYGDFWADPAERVMEKFLEDENDIPEAVICANDAMAFAVGTLALRRGYKIPDDIVFAGIDGTELGKNCAPSLTSAEPDYELGTKKIFDAYLKYKETGVKPSEEIIVPFHILKNQTCGCCPQVLGDANKPISDMYANLGYCTSHNLDMKRLLASVANENSMKSVIEILPRRIRMWSDHFRAVYIKSELMEFYHVPSEFDRVTTMFHMSNRELHKSGNEFDFDDFAPELNDAINIENGDSVFFVRILRNVDKVYGYTIEAIPDMDDRRMQRFNEFSMFLTQAISIVLHNRELTALNAELEKANDEISAMSYRDPMTGIYNRRGFFQILSDGLESHCGKGDYLGIISIDMDGLKKINDGYGHADGDFAITTVAHAVAKAMEGKGICARFGGDEFVCAIVAKDESDINLDEINNDISYYISKTPGVWEKSYEIGFSSGASGCILNSEIYAEKLIQIADAKMYESKVLRKKNRG